MTTFLLIIRTVLKFTREILKHKIPVSCKLQTVPAFFCIVKLSAQLSAVCVSDLTCCVCV